MPSSSEILPQPHDPPIDALMFMIVCSETPTEEAISCSVSFSSSSR